jgi:bifunctional enzyme CysN/CysC
VPHRSYWLKIGTQTLSASIGGMGPIVDVNTMEQRRGVSLGLNDIGQVTIDLDRGIPALRYADDRVLGGFILIDKVTHSTVAAGLVQDFPQGASRPGAVEEPDGAIVWIADPSPAARAAAARQFADRLKALGRPAMILDEEALSGLGATSPDETIRHGREVAKLMSRAGVHALLTLDATPEQCHPGRRVEAGAARDEQDDQWVI